MVYCSNCGQKIDDEANFCAKCGVKTARGKASSVLYPSDQLTDAFYNVGLELERAFNMAAKETHAAIKKARANMQPKPTVTCPKCGSSNPAGAVFCNNCGSRLAPIEESQGSGSQ